MDAEIEDIKRRAGLLSEQDDASPYKDLDFILNAEREFLGKLGQVLARALSPAHRRQVLGLIGNRRQQLEKYHQEKVAGPKQKVQQKQQQRRFQQAEIEKSGGERRPA